MTSTLFGQLCTAQATRGCERTMRLTKPRSALQRSTQPKRPSAGAETDRMTVKLGNAEVTINNHRCCKCRQPPYPNAPNTRRAQLCSDNSA